MGTMSGPIGITQVDQTTIGSGKVGPITHKLAELYTAAMSDENNLFDIFAES